MEPLSLQELAENIRCAPSFPSPPSIVISARRLINDPNSTIKQIATLIESDPAVAGRILRVANSALYGLSRKVSSIETALVVLGIRTTYQIIQAVGVASSFSGRLDPGFIQRLTRHSVLVATTCSLIAEGVGIRSDGEIYTAGLLHDMGHAVIQAAAPAHGAFLMTRGDPLEMDCKMEQRLIGVDHCGAGGLLVETWSLPETLGQCMESHHQPLEEDTKPSIQGVVRLGVYLSEWFQQTKKREIPVIPEDHFASGVSVGEIFQSLEERMEEVVEMGKVLS
ncbi:MAG: HDOD domain-containing protein [Deltaproteobacteria bacterium]|nr:HDOD domain-containing protein [Deltaproteobacteria bacterium]